MITVTLSILEYLYLPPSLILTEFRAGLRDLLLRFTLLSLYSNSVHTDLT